MKRILSLLLLSSLLCSALLLGGCRKKIKDLSPYKETFRNLIEASFAVNDILYGEGLPVYGRDEGIGEMHYSEEGNRIVLTYFQNGEGRDFPASFYESYQNKFRLYYWLYEDEAYTGSFLPAFQAASLTPKLVKFRYITYRTEVGDGGETEYKMKTTSGYAAAFPSEQTSLGEVLYRSETACYYALPEGEEYEEPEAGYLYTSADNPYYDVVSHESKYQSIEAIKAACEAVYSSAYLSLIYGAIFDGARNDYGEEEGESSILLARYLYESDGEGNSYLKKCNLIQPLFTEQRTYDYDSMQIVKPYGSDLVNVELTAYGEYLGEDKETVQNGAHTVRLTFILENGIWRLDSPTY